MTRALVVTTIHQADDPRIRERTIGSLAVDFDVTYAAKLPAPSRVDDVEFIGLRGGRIRRWFTALRLMASRRFAVVSVHDPELIPAGLLVRLLGRRVVVDVHEDVPAQIRHKSWVARPLRRPLAWLSHRLLRLASRFLSVSLAEPGYRGLFARDHPVFPNYASAGAMPDLLEAGAYVVYVGDVTEDRGALDMVAAVGRFDGPQRLVVVGRCPDALRERLAHEAVAAGIELTLTGNLPHGEAMERAAGATVGLSLLRRLPNEAGSMPTKVIEYLQVGIPVVASDLPGTRRAVEGLDGVWLVPPEDSDAAARAIGAARDPDVRFRVQEQATDLRRSRTWPDAEVRAFYRDVARGQGSGSRSDA